MGQLSKLDAVNRMLRAASELPVNSIDESQVSDTGVALSVLNEVNIKFQLEGRTWNTEIMTITPNASGNIVIGSDVLAIRPANDWYYKEFYPRGGKMYDAENNTFDFSTNYSDGVEFQVVSLIGFEDAPTEAQMYIVSMAEREYQARLIGDRDVDSNLAEYEARAQIRSRREEAKTRKGRWISTISPLGRRIHDRRNDYFN